MERRRQSSSAWAASFGKSSLSQSPLLPCCLNSQGEPSSLVPGRFPTLPLSAVSIGL